MLLSQRRTRCREFTGPTPHSVAVRAKLPSSRPADHLILERQKRDAARDRVLEFTRCQQTCDIKTSWLKSSDRHYLRGTVERQVRAAMEQYESDIEDRRRRLRVLLEAEEQQLLEEMEEKKETTVERQAKMREKAKILRERRESERRQLVSDKLEQLFREQCEELRTIQNGRREQQVCLERAAQVRSRQEQLQQQQEEDTLFDQLWEADRRAKEERERRRVQKRQQRNMEQLNVLKTQTEAAEQQRQKDKELREEEARLMLQQREMQLLQEQREQQQKLRAQQTRRQQLDQGFRLKMKRLAREQQDELQLDMSVLQQLLKQETDEKQEAAQRKVNAPERHGLKGDTSFTLDLNMQKQTELAREREELRRLIEETRLKDEEEKRRQRQACQAYQADLRAQVKHQQQLRCEERAQAQREDQQGLILQQLYDQKKDQILSRPTSHTAARHPFRRAEGSGSASHRPPAH
ncbi:cilia- and flagella-associated protein 53 [Xiphias gladius]|uniref:cilia- and flagella-associated protein 53 n=1 Tax=Xiphias gladius TaxID=8245 RepID=UPI001A98D490|nr:cilia- and flagella-associated protein 53 [Xiphias gladius]